MLNPYHANFTRYSTQQTVLNQIGVNKVVLDVGCNDGYMGNHADKSNFFYGIDILYESVMRAKNIYKDVAVYDLNNLLPLPWNVRFDTIIFADVLEHLHSPAKTLTYFVRNYLKPDGYVIISLPNIANWQIRLKLLMGNFDYTRTGILDKTHLHFFTFKTSLALIESVHLHTQKILSGASVFSPFIKVFPLLRSLLATNIILVASL